MEQGILTMKLKELERQYGELVSRIQLYQGKDHDRIRRELQRMEEECEQMEELLAWRAAESRSSEAAALAGAQREYEEKVERVLEEKTRKIRQTGTERDVGERDTEAMILYAEFAADFAVQAMNHALLAALRALDMQLTCEEKGEKRSE